MVLFLNKKKLQPKKAMLFKVGEGLTPEQTQRAEEVVRQPIVPDVKVDYPSAEKTVSNIYKSIKKQFTPREEAVPVRRAFEKEPVMTKAPPIVTSLGQLGFSILEAIPRAGATFYGEVSAPERKTGEVDIGINAKRLGYENEKYRTAAKEFKDKVEAGENPWIAGLNVVSNKTLDVAFGAQLLSSISRFITRKLTSGAIDRKLAKETVDAFKKNQKQLFESTKNLPLLEREKALADLTNARDVAERVLIEKGLPTTLDKARIGASKYTDVLGRETSIGRDFWSRFAQPDMNIKPTELAPSPIAGLLPGERAKPGQAPNVGLSLQEVEGVGKPTTNRLLTEEAKILRGTKGMTADDIMATYPNIKLKRDIPATTIGGVKTTIKEGEKLTPYELKGNKILLQDGKTYIVSKNQFQNIKGQSVVAEGKPFAPELEGVEETVKGASKWQGDELYDNGNRLADIYEQEGKWYYRSDFVEESPAFKTRKEAMENAEADVLGIYSGNDTKYSSYTLPGGENYREILIKAPTQEQMYSRNDIKEVVENQYGEWEVKLKDGTKFAYPDVATEAEAKNQFQKDLDRGRISIKEKIANKGLFKSSHWDEPNVISHIRLNDRTYKGKKVTFMEELQSDWAREGRDKGFSKNLPKGTENDIEIKFVKSNVPEGHDPKNYPGYYEAFDKRTGDFLGRGGTKPDLMERALEEINLTKGVPYNPLLKNWQELSIKRALKDAVDNNSDYFAWINGEQTSARYNLATQVDNVNWDIGNKGQKEIYINPKDKMTKIAVDIDKGGKIVSGNNTMPSDWQGKQLNEVLGKGLADKIMAKESGTLSGEGLKFGGEWASNLYDRQVKNIVEKLTGQKVEMLDMGLPIEKQNKQFTKIGKDEGSFVTIDDIKKGLEIADEKGTGYIITEDIGNGKFKAIQKSNLDETSLGYGLPQWIKDLDLDYYAKRLADKNGTTINDKWVQDMVNSKKRFIENYSKEFDISKKKSVAQMGIKLTPEVKNKIKGIAPKIKTSGKMFEEKPQTKTVNEVKEVLGSYKPVSQRIPLGEIIKKESNIEDAIFQEAIKKYPTKEEFMASFKSNELKTNLINTFLKSSGTDNLIFGDIGKIGEKYKMTMKEATDKANKILLDFRTKLKSGLVNDNIDIYKEGEIERYTKSQLEDIWNKAQTKTVNEVKEPLLPTVVQGETFTMGPSTTTTATVKTAKTELKATQKEIKNAQIAAEKAAKLEAKEQKIREDAIANLQRFRGNVENIKADLEKRNLSQEDIDNIILEDGTKLVDAAKIKRNNDGSLSTVITKKELEDIKASYTDEIPKNKWQKRSVLVDGKEVATNGIQSIELPYAYFERKGLSSIHDQVIKSGRDAEVLRNSFIQKFKDADLFKDGSWFTADRFNIDKTEAKAVSEYYLGRQGKTKPVELSSLPEKSQKFIKVFDEIINETTEPFYQMAFKMGKEPGVVENYAPLMTSEDIKLIDQGGYEDWLFRKHPAFSALKERVKNAPVEVYEKDYRRVASRWLEGMSQFLEMSDTTNHLKYLINSDEFRNIVKESDYGIITKWLKDITTPKTPDTLIKKTFTPLSKLLRKGVAMGSLALNYVTVLKQALTQIPIVIIEKSLPKTRSKYAKAFGIDVKDLPSISKRKGDIAIQDLQGKISRIFTGAITKFDKMNAQIALNGLLDKEYNKFLKEGVEISPETRAIIEKNAQDKIDMWFGGFFKGQRPEAFREEAGNFILMFTYPLTSQLNGFFRHIFKAKGFGTKSKAIAEVLASVVGIAYMEKVIENLSLEWSDEKEMTKDILISLTGNIPLVGDIAYSIATGQSLNISPVIGNIDNIVRAISKGDGEKVAWTLSETAGLPKQVRRVKEGLQIMEDGGITDNNGKMLAPVQGAMEYIRAFLRGKYGPLAAQDYIRNVGAKKEDKRWFVPEVEFIQNGDYERKAEIYKTFDEQKKKEFYNMLSEGQQKKLDNAIKGITPKSEGKKSLSDIFK